MRIQFFDKNAKIIDKTATVRNTPHGDNIDFLTRNPQIWNEIDTALKPIADDFIEQYLSSGDAYLNSGSVAVRVCKQSGFEQDTFHRGLVGSALLEYLDPKSHKLTTLSYLIASRGEDETWINYFFPKLS